MIAVFIFMLGIVLTVPSKQLAFGDAASPASNVAAKGIMNLREEKFIEGSEYTPLHGEWAFYWQKLLEPDDLKRISTAASYITVPASWKTLSGQTGVDSTYGYGTYRLQLQIPEEQVGQSKALYIRSIGSAYRIWIDGQEKPGLGKVGKNRQEEVPQAHINLIFMQPMQSTVEIVIQASNFSFREGGIISEMVYGDTAVLIPKILKSMLYDLFLIGGFVLMGLFHLVIYRLRKKDTAALILGIVYLMFAARTLFINGYVSAVVIGIESWELLVKLEYMSELIGFLFLALLMKHMYPREAHRYMLYITIGVTVILSVYVLFTPARIFTETMIWQSIIKGLILLYFIFYVGIMAMLRKREGAFINLVGLLFMVAALVNDTLYWARLVDTKEWFAEASILFLLAQAVVVSYRYSLLSQRNDNLVTELGRMNETLEEKVAARTRNLNAANEELSEMKEIRTKMLANIAHDLGTPLVGVQTYLQLMAEGKLPAERQDITRLLLEKTDYIKRLIGDLFDLSKLESEEQVWHYETVDASEWLNEVFVKLSADLHKEHMTMTLERNEPEADGRAVRIKVDRFRLLQALHNLVDNAVKFSRSQSNRLSLNGYVRRQGELYHFVVEIVDYGIGIAEEDVQRVFRRFYMKREGNERGTGLGLAIVKEIVERHGGSVEVQSEPGSGSTFVIALPVV